MTDKFEFKQYSEKEYLAGKPRKELIIVFYNCKNCKLRFSEIYKEGTLINYKPDKKIDHIDLWQRGEWSYEDQYLLAMIKTLECPRCYKKDGLVLESIEVGSIND